MAAKKYDHIDFKPPKAVADAAAKGLQYRQKASGHRWVGKIMAQMDKADSAKTAAGPVSVIETTAGKLALVLYGSSNTIDLVPANARRNEAGKWVYSDRSGSYPVKEVKPGMRVLVRDDGVEGWVDDLEGGWAAERFGISGKIGVRDMKKVRSAFPDKTAALEDACWEGYEAVGMKDQDGKQVPNCVPKAAREADSDGNYMSVKAVRALAEHAQMLEKYITEEAELPDWVEAKITRANSDLADVAEHYRHSREATLRERLIRLAHAHPEMRTHLLPLLQRD